MFIEVRPTPNPAALQFVFIDPIDLPSPYRVVRGEPVEGSSFIRRAFLCEGVDEVLLTADFVSVRINQAEDWPLLKLEILALISEYLEENKNFVDDKHAQADKASFSPEEALIEAVIDQKVRPLVARDGGDVLLSAFDPDRGIVYIEMQGACGGCPSSQLTLKSGIERILTEQCPGVKEVREIESEYNNQASPIEKWKSIAQSSRQSQRTRFTYKGQEIK